MPKVTHSPSMEKTGFEGGFQMLTFPCPVSEGNYGRRNDKSVSWGKRHSRCVPALLPGLPRDMDEELPSWGPWDLELTEFVPVSTYTDFRSR